MGAKPAIGIGDLARACHWLGGPARVAVGPIGRVLGLEVDAVQPEEPRVLPAARPRVENTHQEIAEPAPPEPVASPVDRTLEWPSTPGQAIQVELLRQGRRGIPLPDVIQNSAPFPTEASLLPPPARMPPLLPRQVTRSFLREILGRRLPSDEIDLEALVAQLAAFTFSRDLPRLRRQSLRQGVQVLVDENPAMQPFRSDIQDLLGRIRDIAGPSFQGQFPFRRLPGSGRLEEFPRPLRRYRRPRPGTTLLMLTDCGIGQAMGQWRPQVREWHAFARRMESGGNPIVALVPYAPERWPRIPARSLSLTYWGLHAGDGKRVDPRDLARLLAPAAVLDRAMIRHARRHFFPKADPGLEADFLLSPLIEVANASLIALPKELVQELRDELTGEPEERERALAFIARYRREFPPAERLKFEEALVASALRVDDAEFGSQMASAIHALVDRPDDLSVARWAANVEQELPGWTRQHPLRLQLKFIAMLRLGILPEQPEGFLQQNAWALPEDTPLEIKWSEGRLYLQDAPMASDSTIQAPGTLPRHVTVKPLPGGTPIRLEIWPAEKSASVSIELPTEIEVLSGASYLVELEEKTSAGRGMGLAIDSSGHIVASGSADHRIRWSDLTTGELVRFLPGHAGRVTSMAFHPTLGFFASGGEDGTINLSRVSNGKLMHTLRGHRGSVLSLVFNASVMSLASGGEDGSITMWDIIKGEMMGVIDAHLGAVRCIAFDPQNQNFASAGDDGVIKVWDAATGKLRRTLEGHTRAIDLIAFSPHEELLASKSRDQTIHLWATDSWETVAVIPAPTDPHDWLPALAFHPHLPVLATGSFIAGQEDRARIDIWELDYEELLGGRTSALPSQITRFTTAKIVLLGDSGVGKTGLGWRLAHGEFKEHASTHGQQFWVMPELSTKRSDGTECEAILWDLAGQPDYRLINTLFLDGVDLALVLFDRRDARDPLRGVEFWLRQFSDSRGGLPKCPILLVSAREDRGSPMLTEEELQAFCEQRGLSGYAHTSARSGLGLEELIARMKALIPWNDKPATVTTQTFKRVKDFVLSLKERTKSEPTVLSWDALRQQLAQTDAAWQFTDAEMKTAVGHLENYGYVRRLRLSESEDYVLLKPELLNNLAASFILEARRNEMGAALDERRLLAGEYRLYERDGLPKAERALLVDAVVLLFLERLVSFREQTHDGQRYLVFPGLINLTMPPIEEKEPIEEGPAYTVKGAVENVYASLVVLLGYTQTFTRTEQWKDQARYEVDGGAVCGFRQETERNGELDFVLYFGVSVGQATRMLFQGLFESFLARQNLTVTRFEPVICASGHVLDRAVVREQLARKREFAFCSICGERTALPKAHEPIQLSREQQAEVEAQRRTADRRTRFEQAIFRVQAYVKDQKIKVPECFISYAWGAPEHERWVEKQLATDLQKAGLEVILDRWHNAQIGANVARFVERILRCDRILMVGTPSYRRKYDTKDSSTGYIVAAEMDLIHRRLLGTEVEKSTIIPLLLDGDTQTSLPPLLQHRVYADFRNGDAYFPTVFDLILSLYQIPIHDPAVADLRESLRRVEMS